MERLRQVTLAAAVVAAVGGCAATDRLSTGYLDARRAVGLEAPAARPATQVSLLFEKRLRTLPDPTRPDATQAGLPGQLFVSASDGQPTDVAGPVVVTVTDRTPRPAGQPPRSTEKWEFTPDVLARLKTRGGQLGDCYVLFLPWPEKWEDVSRVTIRCQYKAAGSPDLFSEEAHVALEAGGNGPPGWVETKPYAVPVPQGLKPGEPPPAAFKLPPPAAEPPPGFLPSPPGNVLPPPAAVGPPPTVPQTIVLPRS